MDQYQTKYGQSHVKIVFELEQDEDGYPPEKWESIWALPIGKGKFKIDNIPFYVPSLSCDDIVTAEMRGTEYFFQSLIERSNNSTIRMIIYDKNNIENVRQRLVEFGCDVEKSGTLGFFAVNIPTSAQIEQLITYLEDGHNAELWDYEEASLRF